MEKEMKKESLKRDSDIDALINELSPHQKETVGQMFRIMQRLDFENRMMMLKIEKTDQQHEELFGILFLLLRREPEREVFFSLDEIKVAGMMSDWRMTKTQINDGKKKGIDVKLIHVTDKLTTN